jgi:hypothetical protein
VNAQTVQNDAQYQAVLLELIEALQVQIALLQEQLAIQKRVNASQTQKVIVERPSTIFGGETVLNKYNLTKKSDRKNITNLTHRQFLKRVYEIFPTEFEDKLSEFIVVKDDGSDFDAFVKTIPPDHMKWAFAVNTGLLGRENTESGAELIVHELAHIISYESIIGVPLPTSASCHRYFQTRGCPKDNSYLAVFLEKFWNESELDRALVLRQKSNAIDEADEYFESNKNQYVSGYAALSPEEDFAESFAQYVVNRRPHVRTPASEKVWWFDQFTNLQDIRAQIE